MSRSVPFHRILQILLLPAALFLLSGDVSHQPPRAVALPPLEQTSEGGGFVPGELLVKPARGASGLSAELAMKYPVALKEELAPLGVLRLGVPEGRELEIIGLLRSDPRVEWAELNHVRTLMAVPDDRLYRQFQWNLRQMQMEKAWEISTGSQEVLVAVLDTGIDRSHPDLEGKLLPGRDMLNDDSNPEDDSGHGTHKAGVVGALSNNGTGVAGISWGARILPVKVLNSSGVGPDSVIARGITYAADEGARVINMSFGSSTSSQLLADAVRYATQKGSLLVAAAGNTARVDNAVIYPAAYPQVLAVAATDENDEVADFSQHHSYVGISAPGVHIVSTFWRDAGYGSYVSSSGTSDAAPHVSGLAALIWSVNPGLSPAQVKKIIQDTADDLGTPGNDEYYGTGRINAYKALL
ncbi:MAG TPA: S8 family peptidase, partial [Chloroflexota bacterium]|nr:S8 family peptidase [Chloroflexota bacterium]